MTVSYLKAGSEMKKIVRFLVLYWSLVFAFGVASGFVKLNSPIPLENYWQRWCHNWPGLGTDFLFGSFFLIVGFSFIIFPKKMVKALMRRNEKDEIELWGLVVGGFFIILPGIQILSSLFSDWITYCS